LYVHDLLKEVDIEAALSIHPNNLKRVIRALEFYKVSGIRQSEHIARAQTIDSPYNAFKFGIYSERETLYERINKRVEKMLALGLVEEVQSLKADGVDERYTSMQAIGYKEVLQHLNGNITYEEMAELIKKATRNYAKRQNTWFKREQNTTWLDLRDKKIIEIFKKTMELC